MPGYLIQPIIRGNACVSGQNQGTMVRLCDMAFTHWTIRLQTQPPSPDVYISTGRREEGSPGNSPTSKADITVCLASPGSNLQWPFISAHVHYHESRPTQLPPPVFQDKPHPSHSNSQKAGHFPFRSPSPTLPQLLKSFPCAVWNSWLVISTISYVVNLFPEHSLHLLALTAIWNSPKDAAAGAALSSHGHVFPTHDTTGPESKAGLLLLPC